MATLSIPLSPDLELFIDRMIKEGRGANKADVVRQAIREFEATEAVEAVLRAQREPTLRGDLKTLMRKIK